MLPSLDHRIVVFFIETSTSPSRLIQKFSYDFDEDFHVTNGRFVFTLRRLYECVFLCYGDYRTFRSELFSCHLNAHLADIGYQVNIHVSTGKVDSNHYVLEQITS